MPSTFQIDFGAQKQRKKSRIVGIDLGTTNSLVAYLDLTAPKIIPGADGQGMVPSVVSADRRRELCRRRTGAPAAHRRAPNAPSTR